jgi:transglutaminase-like putative cysteine protease
MTYPDVQRLLPGDAGAYQTLRQMSVYAQQAAAAFPGPTLWPNLEPTMRARAIRGWLERHTRYREDPPGIEHSRHPLEMLASLSQGENPVAGDCDDIASLGAAVALACGLRARWRMVRLGGPGSDYGHVFAEVAASHRGPWVDLDVTRPQALPGLLSGQLILSPPIELT